MASTVSNLTNAPVTSRGVHRRTWVIPCDPTVGVARPGAVCAGTFDINPRVGCSNHRCCISLIGRDRASRPDAITSDAALIT